MSNPIKALPLLGRGVFGQVEPTFDISGVGKDHIVCCDPATALCGADQRGEPFAMGAPDPKRMCTACAALSRDPHYRCCATCKGDRP